MTGPDVDVVVAVHSLERPIERAVASVAGHTEADVRVTVVAHGIDPGEVESRLAGQWSDRVRVIGYSDGIPSPAGPFNAGLDAATARFTTVLGSDDELEPHAIDSWLRAQRQDGAAVVIPRMRRASGARQGTPVRPFRARRLDPVRDRLAYRTAQLGLVSTADFRELRFTRGLQTGEDIAYGLRLWFSGRVIAYDRSGPAYLVHDERDGSRTTLARRTAADEFRFMDEVLTPAWVEQLGPRERLAIAIKLFRAHVLPSLGSRIRDEVLTREDLGVLGATAQRLALLAPDAISILSRRDARLATALRRGAAPDELRADALRRQDYRLPGNLVPASITRLAAREAPLRVLVAARLS